MEQQGIKPYVIGLDLGGTNSVFGIVDARGEIKATTAIKTGGYTKVEDYVKASVEALQPIIEQVGGIEKIKAMGIGAPNGNYYNGTYLADTLGFLPGTICFEGKTYENLSFDLDAVLQHVLMQREGSPIILDLGQERVSSFTRGSKTYVNLPALGYDVPAGFYERVAEGRGVIYKRVSKTLYHLTDLNHDARGFIGYDDPNYRSNLFDYYQLKELWYWIQEDGTVQRLKSKRKIKTALQAVQAHETH